MKVLVAFCFVLLSIGDTLAHVVLDSPVGGESYDPDEMVVITWHIQVDHPQENWDLYFSTDAGATWQELAADLPITQLSYSWTVPNVETSQARIKVVMDNVADDYESESEDFSIGVFLPLILNYPMGNEIFYQDSLEQISWQVNGLVSFDSWNLFFSSNGGYTWSEIAENLSPETLLYDWIVPDTSTSKGRIKLEMNIGGTIYADISGIFTISEVVITSINDVTGPSDILLVYPNPIINEATFEVALIDPSPISLNIYNQTGRLVYTRGDFLKSSGSHIIKWNPENIPSGLYFYQLHTANGIESGKLLFKK